MSPLSEEVNGNGASGKGQITTTGDEKDPVTAPKKMVDCPRDARTIYDRLRQGQTKRVRTYARIQGMIDGNPPYKKEDQARTGTLTNSNVNLRDGESITDSVCLVYWSLFNDVRWIAQFTTTFGKPDQQAIIGQTLSEEFDTVIRKWKQFPEIMSAHQQDLIHFGISFLVWIDERDWQFESADVYRVLLPDGASSDPDKFTIFAVEHTFTSHELWARYDEIESDSDSKWSKEALGEILWQTSNMSKTIGQKDSPYSGSMFAQLQQSIRNGDTTISEQYNDDILLVSLFVKEFDGKISRSIIHPVFDTQDWIFNYDRQYDRMSEIIQVFSFTPGQKFLHGNKGVGHRIFNTIEATTRLDNSLIDSGCRASTVLVRSRATRNKDLRQMSFVPGGFVDIGESEFVQNLMGQNLQSQVGIAQYLSGKLERNNNISGTSMSTPDGKQRSQAEVRVQTTKEAKVQKNRIAHYYNQFDYTLREIVRKMLKCKKGHPNYDIVKSWKERCILRGVPAEIFELTKENEGQNGLPEHLDVTSVRASGSGSQFADQIEMDSIMRILPTLGERGRTAAMEDYVSANRGVRFVDRYLPPEDKTNQPVGDDTIASIENNQLEKGEMVVISPDNNHAAHAPRHLQRLEQLVQTFQQAEAQAQQAGEDKPSIAAEQYGSYSLTELDVAFQTIGPHFVRHLMFLSEDPTRQALAQSLNRKWAILANIGDKVANNAQEHRVAQIREQKRAAEELAKQQSQMSMEERLENKKIDLEAQRKEKKLYLDAANASKRESLQYMTNRMRVSFENELKRDEARADLAKEIMDDVRKTVTGKDSAAAY